MAEKEADRMNEDIEFSSGSDPGFCQYRPLPEENTQEAEPLGKAAGNIAQGPISRAELRLMHRDG
jgi:hypothetical protein